MTSFDDAVETATPIWDQPAMVVRWKELPDGESGGRENLALMGDVLSGQYSVTQSYDDALPDDVTMTSSNDASGKFEADLLGRPGHTYASWSAATSAVGENAFASTYIGSTIPTFSWGMQMFMAIVVPSDTAELTQGELEGTEYAWDLVTTQTDGTVKIWLYTKRAYTGMVAPSFYSDVTVANTTYCCVGVKAVDPAGNELRWNLSTMVQSSAPSSATTHQQTPMTVDTDRSVFFGFWGSLGGGTWSPVAGVLMGTATSPTTSIIVTREGLYTGPRTQGMGATRSTATDTVAMIGIALEPFERPMMTPGEFWSPFNEESPVVDFERDTAAISLDFNVVTEDGTQGSRLYTGQMDDVAVGGGNSANLESSSLTRSTLNRSVNLPIIFGRREGGSIDFLISWLAARSDRFVGPAPGPYARWWVPCYGSIHDGLGGSLSFHYEMYWTPTEANIGLRNPTFVEGPFLTGAFACHTENYTQEIVLQGIDLWRNDEIWPWVTENYLPSEYAQDIFSFGCNSGRVSFWVRGDATYAGTPPNVGSGNRYLFNFTHQMLNSAGAVLGSIRTYMEPDRQLYVQMGNATDSYTTLTYGGSLALPTDDAWHFYSVSWSYDEGTMKVRRNGVSTSTSQFATDGRNGFTGWYDTEAALYASGGKIDTSFRSHLPMSDFIMETGYPVYSSSGSDIWPVYPWPSFTMTTRPTGAQIATVPDDSPVNAWESLADLARNTMSMYRADEYDGLEFLPPVYWGESTQQTVAFDVDTELNAEELTITADPTKSRNVVTVKFLETSIDEMFATCLAMTTVTEIPPGLTDVVFTLDYAIAEIHGAATPYSAVWTITNLTQTQITAGTGAAYDKHYMSVNTVADGSGVVLEERSVLGLIIGYTQTTVTIRFQNKTGKMAYLANNYQGDEQLPSLRILGYLIKQSDAYVTERDGGSIGLRRERAMEVDMDWVHDRFTAQQLASVLVSTLAHPRHEIKAVVMGDPRRRPGQVVEVRDPGQSKANGIWRVMSIEHNIDGPQYTQTLQLVNLLSPGVWDQTSWDQASWGE